MGKPLMGFELANQNQQASKTAKSSNETNKIFEKSVDAMNLTSTAKQLIAAHQWWRFLVCLLLAWPMAMKKINGLKILQKNTNQLHKVTMTMMMMKYSMIQMKITTMIIKNHRFFLFTAL